MPTPEVRVDQDKETRSLISKVKIQCYRCGWEREVTGNKAYSMLQEHQAIHTGEDLDKAAGLISEAKPAPQD